MKMMSKDKNKLLLKCIKENDLVEGKRIFDRIVSQKISEKIYEMKKQVANKIFKK